MKKIQLAIIIAISSRLVAAMKIILPVSISRRVSGCRLLFNFVDEGRMFSGCQVPDLFQKLVVIFLFAYGYAKTFGEPGVSGKVAYKDAFVR